MLKPALVKKNQIVNEFLEKVNKSETLVVVEYNKLKVSDLQNLREQLRKNDSELKVYKNTLVTQALKDSKFKDLIECLVGQNAFVFGYKDQLAPAKVSAKFAKNFKSMILKGGIYNGKVANQTEINTIASLPSRDELYAIIAMLIKQPIIKLALGVKELINLKNEEVGKD